MTRLIDADEMLKRLESWNTDDEMDKALYNFTLNRIIEQPTVKAVPVRHGKWIYTYLSDEFVIEQTCSECGVTFEDYPHNYKYCPMCGARMDKDERD